MATGRTTDAGGYGEDVNDGVVVAVLAGGRSTRMGRVKADVDVAGRTMRAHVLAAVAAAGLDAIEVGGGRGIPDLRAAHRGPLAGVEAALTATEGPAVIAVAVDQPWLLPATLRALAAGEGDAFVPYADGKPQVTCARYAAGCLPAATQLLDAGLGSIQGLLAEIQTVLVPPEVWATWGEDGRSWFSADTAEAVAAGLGAFGAPGTLHP
ncbi:MAG: hypothetical protein EHM57_04920 [Actinobacteria bacterium]|nr:MAG: hypothetical protein EHM57_04920 [Actinomycetota bacterium]